MLTCRIEICFSKEMCSEKKKNLYSHVKALENNFTSHNDGMLITRHKITGPVSKMKVSDNTAMATFRYICQILYFLNFLLYVHCSSYVRRNYHFLKFYTFPYPPSHW